MKASKRWRYYCDHCNKSGGSKASMQKHERVCTANPARVCNMHGFINSATRPNIQSLMSAAKVGLKELTDIADGCPACMLAGIRQLRATTYDDGGGEGWPSDAVHSSCSGFQFKTAIAEFWKVRPRQIRD